MKTKNRVAMSIYNNFVEAAEDMSEEEAKSFFYDIILYGMRDRVPDINAMTPLRRVAWKMALPKLDKDLAQFRNAIKGGAKPGNQNARKVTEEKDIVNDADESKLPVYEDYRCYDAEDYINAWNSASANKWITQLNEKDWTRLGDAWPEIGSIENFKKIVRRATEDNLFDGASGYFGYLFNHSCRYRRYL